MESYSEGEDRLADGRKGSGGDAIGDGVTFGRATSKERIEAE